MFGNSLVNDKVSKGINLSHIKLIVYSEEIAKKDLSGHVNVFISHTNIRPRASVVVCEGKAKDFLENISPKLEASPSRYYELLFGTYNYTTQSEPSQLIDLYTAFQCIDRNAYTTYVRLSSGENEAEIAGIAIFNGTRCIGANIEEDFLLAHSILTNNLKQIGFAVPDFQKKDRVISVQLVQSSPPNIKVTFSGDSPHITCNIHLEAHLISSGSDINFYEKSNKEKLTNLLNSSLEEKISQFFEKTIHDYQVDTAGIGKYAKINFITWQDFEKYHWLSRYKDATYHVKVNTNLNVSQIISHIIPNVESK